MTDLEKLRADLVEIYGRIGNFHITPCDGAIPISEADRLAEKTVEKYAECVAEEERKAVVAWLRLRGGHADDIEAGKHLK
jgi:hypothetical protein